VTAKTSASTSPDFDRLHSTQVGSIQTTKRHLVWEQEIEIAVNDSPGQ
jgi:hypothetical protein